MGSVRFCGDGGLVVVVGWCVMGGRAMGGGDGEGWGGGGEGDGGGEEGGNGKGW